MIKGIFKFIFGTIAAVVITAICFVESLIIGYATTGSWDIREWKKSAVVSSAYIAEYLKAQSDINKKLTKQLQNTNVFLVIR